MVRIEMFGFALVLLGQASAISQNRCSENGCDKYVPRVGVIGQTWQQHLSEYHGVDATYMSDAEAYRAHDAVHGYGPATAIRATSMTSTKRVDYTPVSRNSSLIDRIRRRLLIGR